MKDANFTGCLNDNLGEMGSGPGGATTVPFSWVDLRFNYCSSTSHLALLRKNNGVSVCNTTVINVWGIEILFSSTKTILHRLVNQTYGRECSFDRKVQACYLLWFFPSLNDSDTQQVFSCLSLWLVPYILFYLQHVELDYFFLSPLAVSVEPPFILHIKHGLSPYFQWWSLYYPPYSHHEAGFVCCWTRYSILNAKTCRFLDQRLD